MYSYRWTARSMRESHDIGVWWARNRALARTLFDEELDAALDLACRYPDAGESVIARGIPDARRLVLPKTGYLVIYNIDHVKQRILVQSIRSGKRRPVHRRKG